MRYLSHIRFLTYGIIVAMAFRALFNIPAEKRNSASHEAKGWFLDAEGLVCSGVQPVSAKIGPDGTASFANLPEIYDPLESMPEFASAFSQAETEATSEFVKQERHRVHPMILWYAKKRILRERFHINWKSPAELNPHIKFD